MNTTERKKLINESIDTCDELTKAQKVVIKTIIDFEKEDVSKFSIKTLSELTGYSRVSLYSCLDFLEKNNFLKSNRKPRQKVHHLKLEKSKLQHLIDLHTKKQKTIQDRLLK